MHMKFEFLAKTIISKLSKSSDCIRIRFADEDIPIRFLNAGSNLSTYKYKIASLHYYSYKKRQSQPKRITNFVKVHLFHLQGSSCFEKVPI